MNHAGRFRVACVCALTQWALALAIQLGNFFGYLHPPGGNRSASAALFTVIPLIQTQNVLVASIFGAVAWCASWNQITAWIFFGIYCAESMYLLIDQVCYKVFHDHIRMGAFEGGRQFNPTLLLGSFTKEMDWIFYCTAAVAIAGAVWFARALLSEPLPRRSTLNRCIVGVAAVLALIGLPSYSSRAYGHVNEHAVVGLVRELGRQSVVDSLAGRGVPANAIAAFRSDQPADDNPRLGALFEASRAGHQRPNVILIVLESVGAVNLLGEDGLPVRALAPKMAELARTGVTFNSVYTTFPGTTRSLISLHTGGRQPTYGGIVFPLYQGPMLPRTIGELGYDTAFFSSERMDGEGTNVFLKDAGFGKYYDFSEDAHAGESRYQIHSWGAREEYTLGLIEEWMKEWIAGAPRTDKPFLLEYMTTATHHPYGAPPGYPAPFPRRDRHADYLNALYYTDHTIGALVDFLRKRGLLKDTIIAITGDHGESFGERHGNNLLHKNFIYDENVREFLLIFDGRNPIDKPVTSSRVGSNGDIMPTLLALLGAPAAAVAGRNLLEEKLDSRPVFFHKQAAPESWGLRDGRWKYIGEIRSGAAELYDLATDPTEQKNIASAQPSRVAQYRGMCRQWFLESQREFTSRLNGYKVSETGDTRIAARILNVGSWNAALSCSGTQATGFTCSSGRFEEKSAINPREPVVAWTTWSLYPDYTAQYEWISPGGNRLVSHPVEGPEPHVTYGAFPGKLPLEPGVWSVHLREKNEVHLSARFLVR